MAATAGIINGTDLLIFDTTHAIAHATTCSLSVSQDMRDASTKASAGWKAVLPGQRSWQLECSGLIALDTGYNLAYLLALITAKTRVDLYFRTANADDFYYHGYAYLTSASADAPNQGNATYTASFVGDGPLSLVAAGAGGEINWVPINEDTTVHSGLYYDMKTSYDIIITIPPIAEVVANIVIKNSSVAGEMEISATGGLLIDGHATVYLAAGQNITIIPNVTLFDATGTFTDSPPV